jgi:hypothetical protein
MTFTTTAQKNKINFSSAKTMHDYEEDIFLLAQKTPYKLISVFAVIDGQTFKIPVYAVRHSDNKILMQFNFYGYFQKLQCFGKKALRSSIVQSRNRHKKTNGEYSKITFKQKSNLQYLTDNKNHSGEYFDGQKARMLQTIFGRFNKENIQKRR